MKSWKTFIGGVVGAVGLALTSSPNPVVKYTGLALAALGQLFTGAAAKDSNVTGGTIKQ